MADKFEDYCKKLTLGSNSFKEIIHKKQIFVDKTDIVNKLCQRGKYKLLQRPNGFGFLQTKISRQQKYNFCAR